MIAVCLIKAEDWKQVDRTWMRQIKPLALHPPHGTSAAAADGGCVPTAKSTGQAWTLGQAGHPLQGKEGYILTYFHTKEM